MKVTILKPTDIDLARLELDIPFDADDEVPESFPGRNDTTGRLEFSIDLDTFKVDHWPAGLTHDMYIKVRDEGIYRLIDHDGNIVKTVEDYVPALIPNDYGDYVNLKIAADGTVTNFKPSRDDLRQLARLIDGVKVEEE